MKKGCIDNIEGGALYFCFIEWENVVCLIKFTLSYFKNLVKIDQAGD